MRKIIFAGLFLMCLLAVTGAAPQSPTDSDKPVWTMEILRVKSGMFGPTLGYLDDNWMRLRAEAKREGAVLSYNRIADHDSNESDWNIVLLTEFKNSAAYDAREKLFASIRKQLPNDTSAVMRAPQEDLYETMSTRVFQDYSDMGLARFQLLSKTNP
jgi:hypothetical protein